MPFPESAPAPYAIGLSGDGKVALCTDAPQSTPFHPRPYLVKDGVATYLLLPDGVTAAYVSAISADGSTVVGAVDGKPARWANGGAPEIIGSETGIANAVNRDGTVVVGLLFQPGISWKPFRWAADTGVQSLPVVQGFSFSYGSADAVSADGKTVVINAHTSIPKRGEDTFLWKEGIGTRTLSEVFAAHGGNATVFDGTIASAISPDGRIIVGRGTKHADTTGSALGAWKLTLP